MPHFNAFLANCIDWTFWWVPRPKYEDYWQLCAGELWKNSVIPNIPGC